MSVDLSARNLLVNAKDDNDYHSLSASGALIYRFR
jgi:hypothetical protein